MGSLCCGGTPTTDVIEKDVRSDSSENKPVEILSESCHGSRQETCPATLDQLDRWQKSGERAGIFVVDEDASKDVSGRMAEVNRKQAAVIQKAVSLGFKVYLICFGSETRDFEDYKESLNGVIPEGTRIYPKGVFDTNGFANQDLVSDVKKDRIQHAVIMGQSTNACCKATAAGAYRLGLTVHTCADLLRDDGGMGEDQINSMLWDLEMGGSGRYTVHPWDG